MFKYTKCLSEFLFMCPPYLPAPPASPPHPPPPPSPLFLSNALAQENERTTLPPLPALFLQDEQIVDLGHHPEETKKDAPIPIPKISTVSTFHKDYRPYFKAPPTYLKWRYSLRSDFHIEYDLDAEDALWLDKYNAGQMRLAPDKLELLIWKLEYLNREATDRSLDRIGATPTEKNGMVAAATTDYLNATDAVALLNAQTGLRDKVRRNRLDHPGKRRFDPISR